MIKRGKCKQQTQPITQITNGRATFAWFPLEAGYLYAPATTDSLAYRPDSCVAIYQYRLPLSLRVVSYRIMEMIDDPRVPSPRSLGIALRFLQPMSQRHIHSPGLSEAEGLVGKQAGHRRRAEKHDVGFRGALLPPIKDTPLV